MANVSVTYSFTNATTSDGPSVSQNFTDIINGTSDGTKDFSISALTCAGAVVMNGAVTLGNASGDDITLTGSLAASIPIKTQYSFDIGSSALGLKGVYFGSSDSAGRGTQIIGATVASNWTLTLPTGVPSTTGSVLTADTAGVSSWVVRKGPTIQKFTSGTGTYTMAAGALYIRVRMVGGGGGGSGAGVGLGAGGNGGNTTFGSTVVVANGGTGAGSGATVGGVGGTASLGTGAAGVAVSGAAGNAACGSNGGDSGGAGGSSFFGGAGMGGYTGAGAAGAAATNSGSGGGGACAAAASGFSGGGAGGFADAIIAAPSATYAYAVGAAGAAGAGASAGGAGGAGIIIVEEYY